MASYLSGSSTMTWQVEQAQDPPQAPEEGRVLGSEWRVGGRRRKKRTFHLEVFSLGDIH